MAGSRACLYAHPHAMPPSRKPGIEIWSHQGGELKVVRIFYRTLSRGVAKQNDVAVIFYST